MERTHLMVAAVEAPRGLCNQPYDPERQVAKQHTCN